MEKITERKKYVKYAYIQYINWFQYTYFFMHGFELELFY